MYGCVGIVVCGSRDALRGGVQTTEWHVEHLLPLLDAVQ